MIRRHKTNKGTNFSVKRRAGIKPWLELLNQEEILSRISQKTREALYGSKWANPGVVFKDGPKWWPDIYGRIKATWAQETFEPFQDGRKMPLLEAVTVLPGVIFWAQDWLKSSEFAGFMNGIIETGFPIFDLATRLVQSALLEELYSVCRMDADLVTVNMNREFSELGKPRMQWSASVVAPYSQRPDKAFRVVDPIGREGASWLSMDISPLKLPRTSGQLPVYVHAHALARLCERLQCWPKERADEPMFKTMRGMCQGSLADSLANPISLRQSGCEFLVEYRYKTWKLGYLAAEAVGNVILIKTFLLCGMHGTPEAEQLDSQLGMTRSDFQWLRYDTLEKWLTSDLRTDTQIRPLLEACGFGDVLRMADECVVNPNAGAASEFRKYIGDEKIKSAKPATLDDLMTKFGSIAGPNSIHR